MMYCRLNDSFLVAGESVTFLSAENTCFADALIVHKNLRER
jgi:hypothetical protein